MGKIKKYTMTPIVLNDNDIQTFIVNTDPVPKGRPRFVKGTGRTYTPAATREATKILSEYIALKKRGVITRYDGSNKYGVAVYCRFYCKRPKRLGSGAAVLKQTKPDIDNYMKLVLDACNDAGVWEDDSMVVELLGQKWYCASDQEPQVQIQVSRLCI